MKICGIDEALSFRKEIPGKVSTEIIENCLLHILRLAFSGNCRF